MALPFIESWITGDKREHHLLQRPRNAPTRTAIMVALMTFYGLSWAAGGNDIIAIKMHLSINQITYFLRAAVFLGPVIAFIITRRWCISLQRHDEEKLLHGYESGVLVRSAEGRYAEKHLPLPVEQAYTLTARDDDPQPESVEEIEASGATGRRLRLRKLRAKLATVFFADNVQKPTAEELHESQHHAEHELHELEAQIAAGPNRHGPTEH